MVASPFLSIILPIYNVEKYLDRCMKSILKQSFKDYEIILVDDGSPDRCGDICDEYAKKDKRIKVIHKENGGLSDARNSGLDVATGKFVAFIDSDDFIHKDMYMILYNAIIDSKSDISQCKFKYFFKEDELNKNIINDGNYKIYNNIDAIEEVIENKNLNANVWNKLYKKELFNDIRFPKGKIHEDEFVTYKVFYKASSISFVVKKFNFFKTIQEYKYHEKEMGTTVDGKDMTQRSASTVFSNSIITDNENGYIAIPFYDITTVGKTDDGDNWEYTYYEKTIEKILVMKYNIETKTFSEYGTIKLDEYTDYFDDYFDQASEDEITAMVNDNDQRDRYRSAFVQDGYIYIFSDRQIRSYSYADLSKPTESVDIVK